MIVLALVSQHQSWVPPIIFILAFGESLAFISLLLPATVTCSAQAGWSERSELGFGRHGSPPPSVRSWATGCHIVLDYRYKGAIGDLRPLARHPNLLGILQKMGHVGRVCPPFLRAIAFGYAARGPRLESCIL
jgi:hypothetical protein